MSFNAGYRPPPPAPSAFFAMQLAQSAVPNAPTPTTTPSAYLPRIPSKLSLNVTSHAGTIPLTANATTTTTGQTASASRNNSASSITALPSLSSSLNNLHVATSLDHLDVCGTRTAEADELLRRVIQGNVKRLSNPSMGPIQGPDSVERTFSRYSDESDSDDDGDEDEDGESYFNLPIRKIDQSRHHQQPHSSAASTPQSRLNHQSGAGRSGLVMNRSRKDRLAGHVSSTATFAF